MSKRLTSYNLNLPPVLGAHLLRSFIDIPQLGEGWFLLCSLPISQPSLYLRNQILNRDTQYCLAVL